MTSVLLNFITGAGIKIFGAAIYKMMELKRQKDLAMINAPIEKIVALQSGEDKADVITKITRVFLAIGLVGTWCFAIIHHLLHPEIEYTILIGKSPSILWSWLFATTEHTTIHLSAGSLLWDFKGMMEILIGFYFVKVGPKT